MECLENYRTAPSGANGVIKAAPLHDQYSHGADAFRIFAEAVNAGLVGKQGARRVQREEKFVPMLKQKAGLSLGVPNGW
jgi:hypothetical protein